MQQLKCGWMLWPLLVMLSVITIIVYGSDTVPYWLHQIEFTNEDLQFNSLHNDSVGYWEAPLRCVCHQDPTIDHAPPHGKCGSLSSGSAWVAQECSQRSMVHNLVAAASIPSFPLQSKCNASCNILPPVLKIPTHQVFSTLVGWRIA